MSPYLRFGVLLPAAGGCSAAPIRVLLGKMWKQVAPLSAFLLSLWMLAPTAARGDDHIASLEQKFRELPMEARRLTGPLFWLHGDESKERLQGYLEKVAEGGNGSFTAESRPHNDWLGPGWYRDLKVCLEAAKQLDLEMWIFDEKWWPSGEVGGKVPQRYSSKYMEATAIDIEGPRHARMAVPADKRIAVLAGKVTVAGTDDASAGIDAAGIDGDSLVDLSAQVRNGQLDWDAPAGKWKVMVFTWRYSQGRRGRLLVDGASRDAIDWYIRTVYQPHYDHFADEFGKTIVGFFYDEPETYGDWGAEVIPLLAQRRVDWKKALVAWKFQLADPDQQIAAKYQYQDAFAEAWGQTFYGGLTRWCHEHQVRSIGHWLEHNREYLDRQKCAGNMFQLLKYSDMGAIDAVFKQFVPGRKDDNTYQTPKLGSSISHVYGKDQDLAMVEIFGARGQDLSYAEMKWWTDHMHVGGINFHIPHSFNPRSPFDRDCPPYFYNSGYEPRWPLYRVYADYTSRLSLMLSGGHHVCPVAFLFLGNSFHVGKAIPPEEMTTSLQDALFDCDWMPYGVFEDQVKVAGTQLHLYRERYRVLIVPAAEVIPHATLEKVKAFHDAGGVVIGYGIRPSKSATLNHTSQQIAALSEAIWGEASEPGLKVCRTTAAGGRSYFLPEKPSPKQIQQVLTGDAGIHPTLEVIAGETDDWLHVLHRAKAGCDLFFLTNQQHDGSRKRFRLRAHSTGAPECWDALRGEITSLDFQRAGVGEVEFSLELEPLESQLIVLPATERKLPRRLEAASQPIAPPVAVKRIPHQIEHPKLPESGASVFVGCPWVWHAADPEAVPPGKRYFRGILDLPSNRKIVEARLRLTADNDFVLFVNGKEIGRGQGGYDDWRAAKTFELLRPLQPGRNIVAVMATNLGEEPNPAGLIGAYQIALDDGSRLTGCIDKSWKSADRETAGWQTAAFDDASWSGVKELAPYGGGAWKAFEDRGGQLTLPPVEQADPLAGRFSAPREWFNEGVRICLETAEIPHEAAAAVKLNGHYAGGFIGKPFRLDITAQVKPGENTILIEPFAPASVRVVAYPAGPSLQKEK